MSITQTANRKYKFSNKYLDKSLSQWIGDANVEMGWSRTATTPGTYGYDVMASSIAYGLQEAIEGERNLEKLAQQIHAGWAEMYVYWRDMKPWTVAGYKMPKKAVDEERNKYLELELKDLPEDEKEKNLVLARFILKQFEQLVEEPEEVSETGPTIEVDESWVDVLSAEMEKPYYATLMEKVTAERAKYPVYPPDKDVFRALNLTGLESVRVVILGQDPYHGPGQAHGLSFSVPHGQTIPPSLVNIFKEINSDLGLPIPKHGCLEAWAERGVLLLNTTLTVRCKSAGSHALFGWTKLTDVLIRTVSNCTEHTVFLLWGKHAQEKASLINKTRHLILEAPHPSPLSAHTGFMGCKHFSKANAYLEKYGRAPIDWSL